MIGGGAQKITVEIGGKIAASLSAALRGAQTQVSSFGRNVNRTMNDAALAGRKGFKGMLDNALWQQAAAGAVGVGLAIGASVRTAAKFESSLTEISKTAQLGQAETKALGAEILKLTGRNETNQSAEQLAAGIKTLVGAGLSLGQAQEAIRGIGRVATATGSEITEVADTSYQLMQNLNVRAADVGQTFEVLAAAGKKGSFELKDMAREFPKVASSAQKLGINGIKGAASLAAMLQVVRRGSSDSSTAANNLVNLLEKITGKDAVKNFSKFGVNIEEVVKNAQAKGLNPLEESIKVIQKITKGDPFKINELFGDMQVKAALAPLLKDFADFEKIRDGSLSASGVIDEDYEKQIQTFQGTLDSFRNSSERLGVSVGNALLPSLTRMAEAVTPLVEKFAAWAEKNPGLATSIVTITGAVAGLVLIAPGIAAVAAGFKVLWGVVAGMKIGATIAGWLPAIISFGGAVFTAMLPLLPWIALIAGVGAAIYAVIKYWPEISTAATRAWWQIKAAWGQFTNWIGNLFNQAASFIQAWAPKVLSFLFPIPALIINNWKGIVTGVRDIFTKVVNFIKETPARVASVGGAVITAIINGLKSKAGELMGWISSTWDGIKNFFTGEDAAPTAAPAGGGMGGGRSASPPGRALGGAVRAGMPYLVGERRPELFVPGMSGAIVPKVARPVTAAALAGLLAAPLPAAAAGGGGVTIHAPVTINAAGGDAMEIRRQVELAFTDIQYELASAHRVLLND